MANRPPTAESGKPQPDKFRDLARELGCDEDEATWDDALRKVASHRPAPEAEKPE